MTVFRAIAKGNLEAENTTRLLLKWPLRHGFNNANFYVSYLHRVTIPPMKKMKVTFFIENFTLFNFVLNYYSHMIWTMETEIFTRDQILMF